MTGPRDPQYLVGILVWTYQHGKMQPCIYWSDQQGERPEIDSYTKALKVAEHDLFYDLARWSLAGAAKAHPAPPVKEAA